MSTADKLNRLLETKQAIKQAIISKGVDVADDEPFAWYADKIYAISSGEGSSDEFYNLRTIDGTNMSFLFYNFQGRILDLSNFNTSRASYMNQMFSGCYGLTSLDLSSFNTSNVINMDGMFMYCNNLQSLDLSSFDTSNVNNMSMMFMYCSNLQSLILSNFNTSNVAYMSGMFSDCSNLRLLNLSNFTIREFTDISFAFSGCDKLSDLILDNCNNTTISKIINSDGFPTGYVYNDETGNYDKVRWIYCKEADAAGLIAPDGWEFLFIDQTEGDGEGEIPLYQYGEFSNNSYITEVNTMVTSDHSDLSGMFEGCTSLTTVNGIDQWDTSNVTRMEYMFCGCSSLTEIDVSNFNTSKVEHTAMMFNECSNLQSLDLSNWDTSSLQFLMGMFEGCGGLKELNLSNFDLTNAMALDNMFSRCFFLHTLRLDNCSYDTINKIITSPNFTTMAHPLGETRKIYVQEANVAGLTAPENWVFINKDTGEEILAPEGPSEIDIPLYQDGQWLDQADITEVSTMVTADHTDLNHMFDGCTSLTTINGMNQWDTSNVTNMSSMFSGCSSLTEIDVSSFNTSKVEHTASMFSNCSNLQSLDLSGFDTSNVKFSMGMFTMCGSLQVLNLSNFDLTNATAVFSMFTDCFSLHTLRLDNCNNDTINKIITSNLPTNTIEGETRTIYCKEENAAGLTAPENWVFEYIQ